MKKDNENFFDIDFKQEKIKASESKQDNDFFDFSMKSANDVSKEENKSLDFEVAEDVSPVVESAESFEKSDEETVDVIENEIVPSAESEVLIEEINIKSQEEKQSIATVKENSAESSANITEDITETVSENDDVIVNVVKWGKAAKESEVKTVSPKKSNLVIEIDDDFEIKMCNFRELSQKEKNFDTNVKKN